ncbi:MAG: hypothetical protein ACR2IV_18320 [Bryobacteraceae bacterium]
MKTEPQTRAQHLDTRAEGDQAPASEEKAESLDPNDSNQLRDQVKGQTTEHASPPRLEDEGQSGG